MPIECNTCLKIKYIFVIFIHFVILFNLISATSIHSVIYCGTIDCLVNVDLNICHVEFN